MSSGSVKGTGIMIVSALDTVFVRVAKGVLPLPNACGFRVAEGLQCDGVGFRV